MSVSSRFIKVHKDVLVEWIWDDSFFYADNYSIVDDTLNSKASFAFAADAEDTTNYNKLPNQLYLIDSLINKYGIADPTEETFLHETEWPNPAPSKFNKVKIWLPLNYSFPNNIGFYLNAWTLNYENAVQYGLTNFFLDTTIAGELNKITTETQPLRMADRLWGKSITLYVPSVYDEALLRINGSPEIGTINYNLTNGSLGLSQTSSIYLDFRFITDKNTILGKTTYTLTEGLITSLPQAPEYNTLSVSIEQATDGDYFLINGLYNGTLAGFDQFMTALEDGGKKSYIVYSITPFEEGIPQDGYDIYVAENFYKRVVYKPVFMFTNTSASIQVEMKLINAVDSSIVTKLTSLGIVGNEVSKYGKAPQPINMQNATKPKLYNSKPDLLTLPSKELLNSHIRRKESKSNEVKFILYPVLTDIHGIVLQDASQKINSDIYYGLGELELVLRPFDNVIKLKVSQEITDNSFIPFKVPAFNSIIQLVFKSASVDLRIPLYNESGEVDLNSGIFVFKINSSDFNTLKKINKTDTAFYLTITTNGVETVLYDGIFKLLTKTPRITKPLNTTIKPSKGITSSKAIASVDLTTSDLNKTEFNKGKTQTESVKNNNLTTKQLNRLK